MYNSENVSNARSTTPLPLRRGVAFVIYGHLLHPTACLDCLDMGLKVLYLKLCAGLQNKREADNA